MQRRAAHAVRCGGVDASLLLQLGDSHVPVGDPVEDQRAPAVLAVDISAAQQRAGEDAEKSAFRGRMEDAAPHAVYALVLAPHLPHVPGSDRVPAGPRRALHLAEHERRRRTTSGRGARTPRTPVARRGLTKGHRAACRYPSASHGRATLTNQTCGRRQSEWLTGAVAANVLAA